MAFTDDKAHGYTTKILGEVSGVAIKKENENENNNIKIESITDTIIPPLKRFRRSEYYKEELDTVNNNVKKSKRRDEGSLMNDSIFHEHFGDDISIKIESFECQNYEKYIPPNCGDKSYMTYTPTPKSLLQYESSSNTIQNKNLREVKGVINCSRIHDLFGEKDIVNKTSFQKNKKYIQPSCGIISAKTYSPTSKTLLYTKALTNNINQNKTMREEMVMKCNKMKNLFGQEDILNENYEIECKKEDKYIPPKCGKESDMIYFPTAKSLLNANEFKNLNEKVHILLDGGEISLEPITKEKSISCSHTKFSKSSDTIKSKQIKSIQEHQHLDLNSNIYDCGNKEHNFLCKSKDSSKNKTKNKTNIQHIFEHSYIDSYAHKPFTMTDCDLIKTADNTGNITQKNLMFSSKKVDKRENKAKLKVVDVKLQINDTSTLNSSVNTCEEIFKQPCEDLNKIKIVSSISADKLFKMSSELENASPQIGSSIKESIKVETFDMQAIFDSVLLDDGECNISRAPPMAKTKKAMAEFEKMYKEFKLRKNEQNSDIIDLMDPSQAVKKSKQIEFVKNKSNLDRKVKHNSLSYNHTKSNPYLTKSIELSNSSLHVEEPKAFGSKNNENVIFENDSACKEYPSIGKKKGDKIKKNLKNSRLIEKHMSGEVSSAQTFELHSPDEDKSVQGNNCTGKQDHSKNEYIFNWLKNMESYPVNHQITHTEKNSNQCNLCGKTFSTNGNLKLHLRIHTGKKPYQCSYCDKDFVYKGNLLCHVRIHTGEKPYQCCYCNKTFAQNITLKCHLKTHTWKNPYQCNHCAKTYSQNSYLIRHLKKHNVDDIYQCSHYNKSFTQEQSFVKQHQIHRAEISYQCNQREEPKSKKTKSSSDENEKEIYVKEANMCNKETDTLKKSTKKSINEYELEAPKAIVIRNNYIKSSHESDQEIHLKKTIMGSKKSKKEKKTIIESDEESQVINSQLRHDNQKDSQLKIHKNHSKNMNLPRMSRIKASVDTVPQNIAKNKKQSNSKMNADKQFSEKTNDPNNANSNVERSKIEDNEIQDESKAIIISDSDEDCEIVKSEVFLNAEVNTLTESKSMDLLHWAIDKTFDLLEKSTDGLWTRTPNQTEQDFYDVLQSLKLDRFEDSSYPNSYNLDVNYRQLYIHLSGVDSMLLQHALLCKHRYPDSKDVPYKHQEDMKCCINL
ncbi:unnamed protein product [Meganyctiphanes norvegica]|uniref:C2H2-type domain-containing protein n=1 Tax=Meganyctiphanes norvegica TaxID=48144 RepID=A0AAV2RM28_MEGNR